jgi:hypothetical protein
VETTSLGLVSLILSFEVNVLTYSMEADVAMNSYILESASFNIHRAHGALENLRIVLFANSGPSHEVSSSFFSNF